MDRRTRDLERMAKAGDPDATVAWYRAKQRQGDLYITKVAVPWKEFSDALGEETPPPEGFECADTLACGTCMTWWEVWRKEDWPTVPAIDCPGCGAGPAEER